MTLLFRITWAELVITVGLDISGDEGRQENKRVAETQNTNKQTNKKH